jgi:hypothetical protein
MAAVVASGIPVVQDSSLSVTPCPAAGVSSTVSVRSTEGDAGCLCAVVITFGLPLLCSPVPVKDIGSSPVEAGSRPRRRAERPVQHPGELGRPSGHAGHVGVGANDPQLALAGPKRLGQHAGHVDSGQVQGPQGRAGARRRDPCRAWPGRGSPSAPGPGSDRSLARRPAQSGTRIPGPATGTPPAADARRRAATASQMSRTSRCWKMALNPAGHTGAAPRCAALGRASGQDGLDG